MIYRIVGTRILVGGVHAQRRMQVQPPTAISHLIFENPAGLYVILGQNVRSHQTP